MSEQGLIEKRVPRGSDARQRIPGGVKADVESDDVLQPFNGVAY
jgi:hypothetical protein